MNKEVQYIKPLSNEVKYANPYETKDLERFIFPNSEYFNVSKTSCALGSSWLVVVDTERYLASMTSMEKEKYIECMKEFFRLFIDFGEQFNPLNYNLFYLWWDDEKTFKVGIESQEKRESFGHMKIIWDKEYPKWNNQISVFKKQLLEYIKRYKI